MQTEIVERNRDKPVQMLGLDIWNGSQSQLAAFQRVTGVDFPLLQRAGAGGVPWGLGVENIIVVDGEGTIYDIIDVRNRARVNEAVDLLLAPGARAPISRLSRTSLNFGRTGLVGTDISLTLTVENTGNAPLEVTGITSDHPDVRIDRAAFTVNPGDHEDVTITLSPSVAGTISGDVAVATNDQTWLLPVDAITIEQPLPSIAFQESTVEFGSVEVGRPVSQVIRIQNDGPGALSVTDVRTDIPEVTFSTQSITVAAGESASITVLVSAQTGGPINGSIEIISNDPGRATSIITVTATAIVVVTDSRADFDGSGTIDFSDFLGFAGSFNTSSPIYDIDENGQVDFGDFLIFARNFGRVVE